MTLSQLHPLSLCRTLVRALYRWLRYYRHDTYLRRDYDRLTLR